MVKKVCIDVVNIYKKVEKRITFKKRVITHIVITIGTLFILTGCATTGASKTSAIPQVINIEERLTVYLYDSLPPLRTAYMYNGGDPEKLGRVKGFYTKQDNSVHCLKWDFYTCGHELFHVLQSKGDTALFVEEGYEHFEEHTYTSE